MGTADGLLAEVSFCRRHTVSWTGVRGFVTKLERKEDNCVIVSQSFSAERSCRLGKKSGYIKTAIWDDTVVYRP